MKSKKTLTIIIHPYIFTPNIFLMSSFIKFFNIILTHIVIDKITHTIDCVWSYFERGGHRYLQFPNSACPVQKKAVAQDKPIKSAIDAF